MNHISSNEKFFQKLQDLERRVDQLTKTRKPYVSDWQEILGKVRVSNFWNQGIMMVSELDFSEVGIDVNAYFSAGDKIRVSEDETDDYSRIFYVIKICNDAPRILVSDGKYDEEEGGLSKNFDIKRCWFSKHPNPIGFEYIYNIDPKVWSEASGYADTSQALLWGKFYIWGGIVHYSGTLSGVKLIGSNSPHALYAEVPFDKLLLSDRVLDRDIFPLMVGYYYDSSFYFSQAITQTGRPPWLVPPIGMGTNITRVDALQLIEPLYGGWTTEDITGFNYHTIASGLTGSLPPSTVSGDFLLLTVVNNGSAPTLPSGWTEIGSLVGPIGTNNTYSRTGYIFRGGSSPSLACGGSNSSGAVLVAAYKGIVSVKSSAQEVQSSVSPGISGSIDKDIFVSVYVDSSRKGARLPNYRSIKRTANDFDGVLASAIGLSDAFVGGVGTSDLIEWVSTDTGQSEDLDPVVTTSILLETQDPVFDNYLDFSFNVNYVMADGYFLEDLPPSDLQNSISFLGSVGSVGSLTVPDYIEEAWGLQAGDLYIACAMNDGEALDPPASVGLGQSAWTKLGDDVIGGPYNSYLNYWYAFRGDVASDFTWLSDNPDDPEIEVFVYRGVQSIDQFTQSAAESNISPSLNAGQGDTLLALCSAWGVMSAPEGMILRNSYGHGGADQIVEEGDTGERTWSTWSIVGSASLLLIPNQAY